MATAEQLQHILLNDWLDCYINDNKQRGFVATIDISKIKYDYVFTSFWGGNDKAKLKAITDGSDKPLTNVFLSLNAFHGGKRRVSNLAQIRNIGIDLDCYKLGITAEQAVEQLKEFIYAGRIPNPNLLIRSGNGLQLVYGLAGGLPPTNEMKYLATYVTNELSAILEPLGADYAANTLERVFRLPGTYNVKPGKPKRLVTAEVWNQQEHTLTDLMEYCTPLEEQKKQAKKALENEKRKKRKVSKSKPKGEVVQLDVKANQGTTLWTLNSARLGDFLRLIQLRGGNIEMRNLMTYDYAFTMSIINDDEQAVLAATQEINSLFADPQPLKTVTRTVKSAFKDARAFCKAYAKNKSKKKGKRTPLPKNLIKPKKTATLLKQHSITSQEQEQMKVLFGANIKLQRQSGQREERQRIEKERIEVKRRSAGVRPMEEYNAARKAQVNSKVEDLRILLDEQPTLTNAKLAEVMGVSTKTIQRLKKQLNED